VKGTYTQSLYVFVPDVDAHYGTARSAGAEIVRELETQPYGVRVYGYLDCEGHPWSFGQRVDDEAKGRRRVTRRERPITRSDRPDAMCPTADLAWKASIR
jgi:hypothetical protein